MPLMQDAILSGRTQHTTGHNTDPVEYDASVHQICQIYTEIETWHPALIADAWHPALIADAWHHWCAQNSLAPAMPAKRDEAFPLYLVMVIRNRMWEMLEWL